MKRFWEVIYDCANQKMEVIGSSNDDTLLTKNVAKMQKAGMKVLCNTPDISIPKELITSLNYTNETNLYNMLIEEYKTKTGKQLKRW